MRTTLPRPVGRFSLWRYHQGRLVVVQPPRRNLVLDSYGLLADIVRGAAPDLAVCAIGDDGTAPTTDDHQLGHEIARAVIPAPGTDTDTAKNLRTGSGLSTKVLISVPFLGVVGTVREAMIYGGLSHPPGAIDEGRAFNHGLIGPGTFDGELFAVRFELDFG